MFLRRMEKIIEETAYYVIFTKYYYGGQTEEERMNGTHSMHGDMRNAYKIFAIKSER
jgi:hypothetical protein